MEREEEIRRRDVGGTMSRRARRRSVRVSSRGALVGRESVEKEESGGEWG